MTADVTLADAITSLSMFGRRSGLDQMIDSATGWEREQCARFVAFVIEFIWLPVLASTSEQGAPQ